MGLGIAALGLVLVYQGLMQGLVEYEERTTARDPATGVMVGAESVDLGPADASCAVLFVHGFAGAGTNFADLPQAFADKGWRVRIMRLPGHGTSPRDFAGITPDGLYKAVEDEVNALKRRHERVVLVGHSMGGALCALAASRHDVDGLILGGAYFGVTYRWYYVLPVETWVRLTSPVLRWAYKGKMFLQLNRREVKDEILCYQCLPAKAGLALIEVGKRAKAEETLGAIRCPVLMLHSHGDVAASPEEASKAFDKMASTKKRAVWLENSNHHVFWDYDHEQVRDESLTFAEQVMSVAN